MDDSQATASPSPVATPTPQPKPVPPYVARVLETNPNSPISPSPLHLSIQDNIPLRELLRLSPSPVRRPRARRLRLETDTENVDPEGCDPAPKRRGRSRGVGTYVGLMDCAASSPRNARRGRRRVERKGGGDETGVAEESAEKVRKSRRRSKQAKKDNFSLLLPEENSNSVLIPQVVVEEINPSLPRVSNSGKQTCLEGFWGLISELVMWKDVAKSSLWFGFGTLCFLSSCFSATFTFNIISTISHVGLLILAVAFFRDSFFKRCEPEPQLQFQLNEDDILRAIKYVFPITNAAISVSRNVFSGEPSMTLKVAPILLFTAKYGHLITLWRLSACVFFLSFTLPKFCSCYSDHIQKIAVDASSRLTEAWRVCQHKKVAAFSIATMFWNMFGVRTRVMAVFVAVVIIRYHRQTNKGEEETGGEDEAMETMENQALVIAEEPSQK